MLSYSKYWTEWLLIFDLKIRRITTSLAKVIGTHIPEYSMPIVKTIISFFAHNYSVYDSKNRRLSINKRQAFKGFIPRWSRG